jgi:hypothetical protein
LAPVRSSPEKQFPGSLDQRSPQAYVMAREQGGKSKSTVKDGE